MAATEPPVSSDAIDAYPLSPLQHGMLFHHIQVGRDQGVDIEQLEVTIREDVDPAALGRAWAAVSTRHPILRTRFRWEGLGSPRQEVVAKVTAEFESYDLETVAPEERGARVAQFLADDRRRGFDLAVAPLWRVSLLCFGKAECRLIWTYSHAILDSCFAEVLREVFAVYEASLRGEVAPLADRLPYRDHIAWLQEDLRARRSAAENFWRERLAGFVTPTNLLAAQVSVSHLVQSDRPVGHDTVRFSLPYADSEALRHLCREYDLRISAFVEAAWALLLGAFSGDDDVVFGVTRACRRSSIPGAESIFGLFINTVPVRANVRPDIPILDLLHQRRRDQIALRAFEHTPLVDVLAWSQVPRGTPLFETIVVFNDQDNDARFKSFGASWQKRDFELHDQTNFPFNVMAYDGPEVAFKLSYDRRRFERSAVDRIANLLSSLLTAMGTKSADATLGELPRLPDDDARALFGVFNETRLDIRGPDCIHEAFEAQVDRTPEAVAIAFRGDSVTYRELDERANRVADELIALGIGADSMVGIFVERSIEMVVGLLGILKAGGAYVPMDPAYPPDRIAWMLEDTSAPVVVTLERLRRDLPPTKAAVVTLDAIKTSARRPTGRAQGNHLAYVIFTSGSTGRPKGVQIEHRNVMNFFGAMDAKLGTTPGVWLALTSISFDISVLEIFWTLARGFTVIVQEEARKSAQPIVSRPSRGARTKPVSFSLFYFAADAGGSVGGRYRLLLEGAKFADTHDFEAVWTPERHFHPFGGLYPNPSVTSAAVAVTTRRVAIRAGSVVLPLHNPIRCAEEWSVVDNLSNGRVGLSFASGWHASDFVLAPDNFKARRELMARGIETVRALWRGDAVQATSGDGRTVEVKMYPPPVQREPRIWITASGSPETFAMAGRMGACILTNLLVMKPEELATNIDVYRKAYGDAGHGGVGHVTLMVHTFVGMDLDDVRATVREPFLEYLKTSTDLINKARWELTAFAKADGRSSAASGVSMNLDDLSEEDRAALLDHAFERYFASAGLFGTPQTCIAMVDRLRSLGVDEIACLLDFGVDTDTVLASLPNLDDLRRLSNAGADLDGEEYGIATQIRRHNVTHMQCTPSFLAMLCSDDEAISALHSLRALLVGGEALSAPLVDRVRASYQGAIHNMYGPTETTIWSTTSRVRGSADGITIGRPIANTRIYIVDRHRRSLPIGVPGELFIGGAGVVRGYLGRPELTAERFVADPFGVPGDRLYRSGDVARWLPSGEIEFLGRSDHQIKIRGYRVELGEIEATLSAHPAVRESVVVARADGGGDPRLVAYVVPRSHEASTGNGEGGDASAWETIWDETYRGPGAEDATFDTAGWRNSFDGQPMSDAEMREWLDGTVFRILALNGEKAAGGRVAEIGCGTGMVLFRVAPRCAKYVAIDFSPAAVAHVASRVEHLRLQNVVVRQLAAHAIDSLATEGPFDVVVINSVVQYFPDVDYLAGVLAKAYELLAPGGAIFVGDVRSLGLLRAFHTAIEMAQAEPSMSVRVLNERVDRRAAAERELVLAPDYFKTLADRFAELAEIRIDLKPGRVRNEMNSFRYDVVIRKSGGAVVSSPTATAAVPAPEPCTIGALRAFLRDEPATLAVRGIPNARVVAEVKASEWMASDRGPETVGELLSAVSKLRATALDPEDLRTIHSAYEATVAFSSERADLMDAVFRHRTKKPIAGVPSRPPLTSRSPDALTNRPVIHAPAGDRLVAALREHARAKLPEYMVPAAFVVLDKLPLTPNGKVDRASLPAPDRFRRDASTGHAPPKNDVERAIVGVLQEILGVESVGADDNFFDVGANSLILVQVSVRLRAVLGRAVPLVSLFRYPQASSLATALGLSENADDAALKEGQDRANLRREAMQRRRDVRDNRPRR